MATAFEALEPLSSEERHRAVVWLSQKLDLAGLPPVVHAVSEAPDSGGLIDPTALVQDVLRESYKTTTEDLKAIGARMKSRRAVVIVFDCAGSDDDD